MQELDNHHYVPTEMGFERSSEGRESLLKAGFTDEQVNAMRSDIWRQFLHMEDTLIPAWFRRIFIESLNEDLKPGCAADIAKDVIRNHALAMINARDEQEENPMPDGMQESENIEKVDRYLDKREKATMAAREMMNIILRTAELHVSCKVMLGATGSEYVSNDLELKKCEKSCEIKIKHIMHGFVDSQMPPVASNPEFNKRANDLKQELIDLYDAMIECKIGIMSAFNCGEGITRFSADEYNQAMKALKQRIFDMCAEGNDAEMPDFHA